jgi:hypothetical protein
MTPTAMALDTLLKGVLPAMAVAAAVMAAIVLVFGKEQGPLGSALGFAAAVGLGFWIRFGLTLEAGEGPWNRLPYAALAALWVGRIARRPEMQPTAGWILRTAVAFAIAWLVIPADTRSQMDGLAPLFAGVVLALWALLERVAEQPADGSVPFAVALTFFVAAFVLISAHTSKLSEASIVVGSALIGLSLTAWWRQADSGGAVPAVAVLLPGVILMGQQTTFNEIPWYGFALPVVAPLVLAEALAMSHWQGARWQLLRWLVMMLLILIPLAAACYVTYDAEPLDLEGMAMQ